ncbi:MAG: alkaline phosphatase family protein [Kiritimatiellia bacterium]
MHKTVVIDVVGLTQALIGTHTPQLRAFARKGKLATIAPVLPAVTCSVQSTFLTGLWPEEHGIVGNGWYFKDEAEIKFWRQSNHLVQGEKIWETARKMDPAFTCAKLFWWYNMYSTADWSVTPRPMYPADGRKLPDIYTQPADLRDRLQQRLGQFPLFKFWGPGASIESTEWIAASARFVEEQHAPTLSLIYLPHLDYCLQREGPEVENIAGELRAIDRVCGDLIAFYEARGARVLLLSEYGIGPVSKAVHINRALREAGWIAVREEMGRELLDAGASRAFAVADHQVAHVYVARPEDVGAVKALLEGVEGIDVVLDEAGKRAHHIGHARAGDLVAISAKDAFFTYYYWLDDKRAPDFARCVDIHRKPGYDPVELFMDPAIWFPKCKVAGILLKKIVGFRYLMDVISLDAGLVRGSHGCAADDVMQDPVLISGVPGLLADERYEPVAVRDLILTHLTKDT